jgi:alkaline phosphatase D
MDIEDHEEEPLVKKIQRQEISKKNSRCTTCCIYITSVFTCLTVGGLIFVPWVFAECSHELAPIPDAIHGFVPRIIGFGSCLDNESPSELLDEINADVFIFLGDNIYADTANSIIMRWIYNRLSCKPAFKRLVGRIRHILSIWDDHDYGQNDRGAEYPMKEVSQRMFLDFWRIPATSARRRNKGVYGSYTFIDRGVTILVIMLDLRTFRGPLTVCTRDQGWYCPAESGTMLGEKQWQWLKHTLAITNADLVIVASSTQYAVDEYGYETWANFPHEQARLASLLNPNKTVIISGDVHWGEISLTKDGLYDITSSGISQLDTQVFSNQYRVGPPVIEFNYGLLDLEAMTASVIGQSGFRTVVCLNTVQSPFRKND